VHLVANQKVKGSNPFIRSKVIHDVATILWMTPHQASAPVRFLLVGIYFIMKSNKPRRVFTMTEYKADPVAVQKEAAPYGGFTVLDKEGTPAMSVSSGPRGILCKKCNELPDWCRDRQECKESWKARALKAETKLASLANQLEEISQEMFW
jgi:hypothetical protein